MNARAINWLNRPLSASGGPTWFAFGLVASLRRDGPGADRLGQVAEGTSEKLLDGCREVEAAYAAAMTDGDALMIDAGE